MVTNFRFNNPGIYYRDSEVEIKVEIIRKLNEARERDAYRKEVFTYVYGDSEIPAEYMIDIIE